MNRLETNIKKHAELFNESEPSPGHFSRFAEQLEKQNSTQRAAFWKTTFSVAASFLVLLTVSYFGFYLLNKSKTAAPGQVTLIQVDDELNEVFDYYDASSKIKAEEIKQFAANTKEAQRIQKQAGKQLDNLDAKLAAIEKEYMKNPGNTQLRAALVNTKRKKSEVIEQIVRQMEIAQSGYYSVNAAPIQF